MYYLLIINLNQKIQNLDSQTTQSIPTSGLIENVIEN